MGARGRYTAQEDHVVNLIPAVDVNAGLTTKAINLKNYEHATIILQFGVTSNVPSKVSLESSDDSSPEGTTAIPFDVFKCETAYQSANGDVLGARVACSAAAGFVPSGTDNIFYVLEVESAVLAAGQNFLRMVLASAGGACLASAVAILSGARYGHDQSESVLG